jgi:hypothetical protein
MNKHPAHQMAETVTYAAEELRGYMDPSDPFPWELTEDDHRALLPCLDRSISALGDSIRGIAEATGDQYAKQQLTASYHRLVQASSGVRLVVLSSSDDDPDDKPAEKPETAQPAAALAASSFPQPMSAGMLREAAPATATRPHATTAAVRPDTANQGRSR